MMVRVLLYGYCRVIYSSGKIQAERYEDVGFRYLAADEHPDHSKLAEFRKRHWAALVGLFTGTASDLVRLNAPSEVKTKNRFSYPRQTPS